MNETPGYFAIIPARVRYDKNLKANEKLLYGEITALSNKYGYCMAKNSYFAKLFEVETRSVKRWISNLADKGYIQTEVDRDEKTRQVIERRIYLTEAYPGDSRVTTPGDKNVPPPGDKNVPYNNTSIYTNNTSNNIYSHSATKEHSIDTVKDIINYLNEKADKNYKVSSYAKRHIQARVNEGYEKEDFFKVIDNKVADWKGDSKFDKYLRPQTLFNTNFEGYLNESIKTSDDSWEEFSEGLGF